MTATSIVAETPRPGPAHISPTAARSYLTCPLRHYFERVARIPKPTAPSLHLGKAVHAALQAFHLASWRGLDHGPAAIERAFHSAFETLEQTEGPVGYADEAARDRSRRDGLRIVAAYLESPERLQEPPRAVEVFLTERVEGLSVPLTGVMDLVRRDATPVDFKSAASRPRAAQAAFEHELQLVSYQLLLEAATGETPPALELVFLVKTKAPQVIKVTARPADAHRKRRVIGMLEAAVRGMASGRYHPQPGMPCGWCQFRRECAAWTPGRGEVEGRAQ